MNSADFLRANPTGIAYPHAEEYFRQTCCDIQETTDEKLAGYLGACARAPGQLSHPARHNVYLASTEAHLFMLNPRTMQWAISVARVDGCRPVFIMPRNQTIQ
jgi:hypothetical protein